VRSLMDNAIDAEDPRADLRWGTVPALVADMAERHPGAEALVDGDRRLTYAQLAEEVTTFTRALMASGWRGVTGWLSGPQLRRVGDRRIGRTRAGAVLVTLNTRFKGGEAAYILRASGAKTLLTVDGFLGLDYPGMLAGEDNDHSSGWWC